MYIIAAANASSFFITKYLAGILSPNSSSLSLNAAGASFCRREQLVTKPRAHALRVKGSLVVELRHGARGYTIINCCPELPYDGRGFARGEVVRAGYVFRATADPQTWQLSYVVQTSP